MAKRHKKFLTRKQVQDVKCPRCWAKPGRWCTDQRGPRPTNHRERIEYALVVNGRRPMPPRETSAKRA